MSRLLQLVRRALGAGKRYSVLPQHDWDAQYPLDCRVFGLPTDDLTVHLPANDDDSTYLHPVATSFRVLARLQADGGVTEGNRDAIASAVRSLRSTQAPDGSWRYPVGVARYDVAPGWSSAMAQGVTVSMLLRTTAALGENEATATRQAVDAAVSHLLVDINTGGCAVYDSTGVPFLEECPAEPVPYILNGACFALIGLSDYERFAGGAGATAIAGRLNALLPRWDIGYYSRYDLLGQGPSSPDYHRLHIALLSILHSLYGMEFGTYARKFAGYEQAAASRLRARLVLAADRLLVTRR